jgi:trans-2,3-dihydro-3-hydroxyanthranilate isomerase
VRPFRQVDVFSSEPLRGNPVAVVHDADGIDDEAMQAFARWTNLSETTFLLPPTDPAADYRLRIFTPDGELPFAGHPTLGTAFVMVSEGRVGSPLTQVVPAGEIPVEVDVARAMAWMTQLPPRFAEPFDRPEIVARSIGLEPDDVRTDVPIQTVSTGLPPLIVPVRDLETLRRARIDAAAVADVCRRSGGEEVYAFAETAEGVTARFFGPTPAIVEDPATGSAAGPLGAYLTRYGLAGMPGRVLVRQGEQVGRPSELHVEVHERGGHLRVRVGGGVHAVGRGVFTI